MTPDRRRDRFFPERPCSPNRCEQRCSDDSAATYRTTLVAGRRHTIPADAKAKGSRRAVAGIAKELTKLLGVRVDVVAASLLRGEVPASALADSVAE